MIGHLSAFLGALPTEVDEDLVTPGVIGFVVTAVFAVLVILLVIDMTRRMRRVRFREEVRVKLDAEEASAADRGETA